MDQTIPLLKAFGFGFTLALSVGPIALLVINNGLNHGISTALRSALGAALADLTYAFIAFTAGYYIVQGLQEHQQIIQFISSAVLILFGLWMLTNTLKNMKRARLKLDSLPRAYGLKATYLLTVVNPLTVIAFVAFSNHAPGSGNLSQVVLLALAVFTGSLLVQITLALFGSSLKKFITNRHVVNQLNIISALGICGFGVMGVVG